MNPKLSNLNKLSKLTNPTERKDQLRTVLWMRSFAVITLLLVLGFAQGMGVVRLPWPMLLFVLGLMLTLNALAWLRVRLQLGAVGPYEVSAQIFADLFGFSVLLYFTGGATNPFVMFYLPLLGLAAALLPWGQVLALAGFSILAYSVLMLEYIPLVLSKPQNAIELHLLGMWINFLVSVAILVGFVARLSDRIRQRDFDLNAAQSRMSRDARMAALGNQSASLAHELGTPLSTAKIILSDWMDNLDGPEPQSFQRDSLVLREQLDRMERCLIQLRSSLQDTTLNADGPLFEPLDVNAWLSNWLGTWRNRNPLAKVTCINEMTQTLQGRAPWDMLDLVLSGLFDNAIQAYAKEPAEQIIVIKVLRAANALHIEVEDRAGGFDKDLLQRLGREPVGNSNSGNKRAESRRGMGLFLAVGLIERAGGDMQFSQVVEQGHVIGARVKFTVPLQELAT